jgi:hypothetical protein
LLFLYAHCERKRQKYKPVLMKKALSVSYYSLSCHGCWIYSSCN